MGHRTRRRARWYTTVLLALVVFVVACNPTVDAESTGAERAKAAKEAARQLEAAARRDMGCGNVVASRDRRATAPSEHRVLLVNAVASSEPCWDRIVFTFVTPEANAPPGYEIEYRDPPFTDLNGANIPTVGEAFLYLTFRPASQWDEQDGRRVQTYTGNLRLQLADMQHTELVAKLTDAEDGTQSWVIGLDGRRAFTVDASTNAFGAAVAVYVMREA